MKRIMMGAAASLMALGLVAQAQADTYPTKAVTVIVPYKAGGNSDSHARLLQPALQDALGADVVVQNLDGAAGTMGAARVAQAAPDGYTLAMMPIAPPTMQPHLRDLPYDVDSFTPICMVDNNPVALMVASKSQYNSLDALTAAANDGLSYASTGGGTVPHLAALGFADAVGSEAKHVPFSSAADAMKAVMGGVVDFFIGPASLANRFDVSTLAIFAEQPSDHFPDVPTAKAQGVDLAFTIWGGLFGPSDLPEDVTERLMAACADAMTDPRTVEAMERIGSEPGELIGEDFADFVQAQYERNGVLLSRAGLAK